MTHQNVPPGFDLEPVAPTPQLAQQPVQAAQLPQTALQAPQGFELEPQPEISGAQRVFNERPEFAQNDPGLVNRWAQWIDQNLKETNRAQLDRPNYPEELFVIANRRASTGEEPPEAREIGRPLSFSQGMSDVTTFGFIDEIGGELAGLGERAANIFRPEEQRIDPVNTAREATAVLRGQSSQAFRQNPVSFLVGGATGGAATLAAGGAGLTAIAPRAAAATKAFAVANPVRAGIGLGATEGTLFGAGSTEGGLQERGQGAAIGGLAGGLTGGAIPGAGKVLGASGRLVGEGLEGLRNRNIPIPELDDLRQVVTQAYQAVDDIGASYSRSTLGRLANKVRERATAMNLNPRLTPKAAAVVDEIGGLAQNPISLTRLDQFRQSVRRDLSSSTEAGERAFGQMIIEQIDTTIDRATPKLARGGDPGAARELMRSARQASRTHRASEVLNDALETARLRASSTGTGGNVENAIRQELRQLIKKKAKTRRLFTQDQINIIERAIAGDNTQNTLRLLGSFSPDKGFLPMVVSGASIATGPLGAIVPAIGFGARKLGEARQRATIEGVTRAVRGPVQ